MEDRGFKKEKIINAITINTTQMKKIFQFLPCFLLMHLVSVGQTNYPIPEYANEVYLLKKGDSANILVRLEKGASKMETKVKMMGMGGMDSGYDLDGEKSPIRFSGGSNLVFIYYTGSPSTSNPQSDSIMRANGMDPNSMGDAMSMFDDPSKSTTLYDSRVEKGKRKILMQSMGLMGKSKKTSTKYTLSVKKVKDKYYEMRVDKTLPKGEYVFVLMSMGSMDQSYPLFAFGID
jgi:hypothetical protein